MEKMKINVKLFVGLILGGIAMSMFGGLDAFLPREEMNGVVIGLLYVVVLYVIRIVLVDLLKRERGKAK